MKQQNQFFFVLTSLMSVGFEIILLQVSLYYARIFHCAAIAVVILCVVLSFIVETYEISALSMHLLPSESFFPSDQTGIYEVKIVARCVTMNHFFSFLHYSMLHPITCNPRKQIYIT